jgi:hypothetical protein
MNRSGVLNRRHQTKPNTNRSLVHTDVDTDVYKTWEESDPKYHRQKTSNKYMNYHRAKKSGLSR